MKSNLKIAITGASGFIGQHLLEDIDFTNYSVKALTRNLDKKMRVSPAACEIVKADLRDYESLNSAFKGVDVIINIAAEVRNDKMFAETNIAGTQNLINAAIANNVSKIIHISSVGVVGMSYSKADTIVDENTNCFPSIEYERTKLESEKLLIEANKKNDFKLTLLRPTNVFGEYHSFNALLNLMQRIIAGKFIMYSNTATVNYIYVKDLTAIILKLIEDEKEYGILNVGSSEKLGAFLELISDKLGIKNKKYALPQIVFNFIGAFGIKKLNRISNHVIYDDGKLQKNFQYPYGLAKGIERTILFYKQKQFIK